MYEEEEEEACQTKRTRPTKSVPSFTRRGVPVVGGLSDLTEVNLRLTDCVLMTRLLM